MKVLEIGGGCVAQSLSSAMHGLQLIGHDWDAVLSRKHFKEGGHELVIRKIDEAKPETYDMVFLWNPKREITPDIVASVAKRTFTVYSTVDDPQNEPYGNPIRRECHAAVTCCADSRDKYRAEGQPAELAYPPYNMMPGAYTWMPNPPEWKCDVGLLAGNCYTMKQWPTMYASRADMARRMIAEGFDFKAFGWWDERKCGWAGTGEMQDKTYYGAWVPPEDNTRLFARMAVNLNSHVRPEASRYYNERMFHSMGAGTFTLTDHIKDIEHDFTPGVHLDTWKTLDELAEKTRYYLTHPGARKKIARAGQVLVFEKYSNIEYAKTLVRLWEEQR